MENESFYRRARRIIFGAPRDLFDPKIFHNVSLIAFFAWVGLGADGISSSSYGPEEAYLALGGHTILALFVAAATVLTVFIISASYSQIIEAFPSGGGGYIVASKLLGEKAGVVSGSALVIDYVLTITISVAAGADAIFSFLPLPWLEYKFAFTFLVILLLIWLNLRGVKESVVILTPIFMAFILTHVPLILFAILRHLPDLPAVGTRVSSDLSAASSEMGWLGVGALLLRAYSMGAGRTPGSRRSPTPCRRCGSRACRREAGDGVPGLLPRLHGRRDHPRVRAERRRSVHGKTSTPCSSGGWWNPLAGRHGEVPCRLRSLHRGGAPLRRRADRFSSAGRRCSPTWRTTPTCPTGSRTSPSGW